tara:strand:+ start:58 stop:669 length:612 start_codon:yes stop_codon:yes gene_type:complete
VKRKPVQEIRREEVRSIFDRVLKDKKVTLSPVSISVTESKDSDFTSIEFSFTDDKFTKEICLNDARGKGFVDCLFRALHTHYVERYTSLRKIKLANLSIDSQMSSSKSGTGSDATASVVFRLEVEEKGVVEFEKSSRSLVYSSFASILKAFEFYINCEATFVKLQEILSNAEQRNRQDIIEKCKFDLSKVTRMNSYEKEKRKE